MENYRKADAVKPGDAGVSMQIGKILEQQKHYAEAEPYFRKVIDKDKSSYLGYHVPVPALHDGAEDRGRRAGAEGGRPEQP